MKLSLTLDEVRLIELLVCEEIRRTKDFDVLCRLRYIQGVLRLAIDDMFLQKKDIMLRCNNV